MRKITHLGGQLLRDAQARSATCTSNACAGGKTCVRCGRGC